MLLIDRVIEYRNKGNDRCILKIEKLKKNYYNILKIHIQLSNHLDVFSQFGYRISIGKVRSMMIPQYTIRVNDYLKQQDLRLLIKQLDDFFLNERHRYLSLLNQEENNKNQDCLLYASQESVGKGTQQLLFFLWFNKDNLLPSLQNKDKDLFFILENDNIILTTKNEKIEKIKKEIIVPNLLNQIQTHVKDRGAYYRLQEGKYDVHVVASTIETIPWKYVYITPKNNLYLGSSDLKIKTALIYLFLLFTGLLLC